MSTTSAPFSKPFSLKDKAVFITGGASGIGLGTVQRFLQDES